MIPIGLQKLNVGVSIPHRKFKNEIYAEDTFTAEEFPSLIGSSKTQTRNHTRLILLEFPSLIGSSKTRTPTFGDRSWRCVSIPHRKFKNTRA